jgi:predicted HAD superfamily Cof-like phosphohydrolase
MSLNQVKEFHITFGHSVEEKPIIPSKERCDLRVELIDEEFKELKKAIADKDIKEIADALADIQYVLNGAFLEFGLGDLKEQLDNEVHRSNMSKSCDTDAEAEATLKQYESQNVACHFVIRLDSDKRIIRRDSDKKILKSKFYSPANLEFVLNK